MHRIEHDALDPHDRIEGGTALDIESALAEPDRLDDGVLRRRESVPVADDLAHHVADGVDRRLFGRDTTLVAWAKRRAS